MKRLLIILSMLSFASCEVKVNSSKDDKTASKVTEKNYSRNTNKIRNGIQLKTTGDVQVKQAFLVYADDGSLVSEENITAVGRKIKIVLLVDGWKEENGLVYLDAAEKVMTSDGDDVLEENNLFTQNNMESVTPKDARELMLSVVVSNISKLVDYFLVTFRIWNRKAEQSIEGEYKFHLNGM